MRKTHFVAGLFAVAGALAIGGKASADLIVNGDFSLGNQDFYSQYNFSNDQNAGQYMGMDGGAGYYGVVGYSTYWHSAFVPFADYTQDGAAHETLGATTPSDGLMMIVNGNDTVVGTNLIVWQQTVSGLTTGLSYDLSFYATPAYSANPATLNFTVTTGSLLPPSSFPLNGTPGTWQEFSTTFVATGPSTTITIKDSNTESSGNDFALDNISLTPVVPLPASALSGSVLLAGVALANQLRRRRQA